MKNFSRNQGGIESLGYVPEAVQGTQRPRNLVIRIFGFDVSLFNVYILLFDGSLLTWIIHAVEEE